MQGEYITWREAYEFAISETKYAYSGKLPTLEEFIGTFEEFWNEVTVENIITMWAVDPPGTKRMVNQKAIEEWEKNYEGQ